MLKESCTLHIRAAARGEQYNQPAALSFNFDFRDELLRPHEEQAFYVATPLGFEPRITPPKGAVLPKGWRFV